ncbi:MAG: aspartate aminotransferase family protein [Phycisphaerales bacterium]
MFQRGPSREIVPEPSPRAESGPELVEGDVNTSARRSDWRASLGRDASDLLERDAAAFVHQSLSTPCLSALRRAEGSWLEDTDGRRYLDLHGNSVHQVGHAHPAVVEAVVNQLRSLPFCPRRYTNRPAIELAERLGELSPWGRTGTKVLLLPSGAAAISLAVKIARLATGRSGTVSMWDSFHGATLDAIAIGGEEMFRHGLEPFSSDALHVQPCRPAACRLGCHGSCSLACAAELEAALLHTPPAAALVSEAVRCTTVDIPPPDYWPRARKACGVRGVLMVIDEIPTGLGRTGRMFAFEHFDLPPDIIVLGKGLGGGVVPMAAVMVRADLPIPVSASVGHFTHEKSPIGAAAALATLDVLSDERLVERSRSLGRRALDRLNRWSSGHPAVKEVRGLGLLIGIELRGGPDLADAALYGCLRRGVSLKVSAGSVLTISPPLNITEDDLWAGLDAVVSSVDEIAPSRNAGQHRAPEVAS